MYGKMAVVLGSLFLVCLLSGCSVAHAWLATVEAYVQEQAAYRALKADPAGFTEAR